MTRRRRRFLVSLLAILIGVPTLSAGCADRLILPPERHATAEAGTERRLLQTNVGQLEAFVARSPGAQHNDAVATILRFTGGDAAAAAPFTASRWQQRPVEVIVVNYPGYGATAGPRTLQALADAALAAFDHLHTANPNRPIILEGFSLGTVPALHIAAHRLVAGLILQNPPPLKQVILGHHAWWNLGLIAIPVAYQVPRGLDSIANAKRCTAPAVFLNAELDQSVPLRFQQQINAAYAGEKRIILQNGADHVVPLNAADEAKLHDGMDWLLSHPRG